MKSLVVCLSLAWLGSMAANAAEEIFHASKLAELDEAISAAINDHTLVGGVLWIERNGTSYHKAFGNRTLKPTVEPMTEDTIFDVASVTKAVATASATMRCVERELISLDDPVSKHLSEWDPLESTCRHASLSIL